MYFICGVHGAGKTTFARKLSKVSGIHLFTAGDLINAEQQGKNDKKVSSIDENQQILLDKLKLLPDDKYILDGHLCLINIDGKVQRIKQNVIRKLGIAKLYIVIDKPEIIYEHMNGLGPTWTKSFIKEFQDQEIGYACEISKLLQVPLQIIYQNTEIDSFAIVSDSNMLLPIKPLYADEILAGTKSYEFRKHLCKKEIKKIYLYSTSPLKRIVGEALVRDRLKMDKYKLWDLTKDEAGITFDTYAKYFKKQEQACAYHIGNVKKYDTPLELKQIGIFYSPQSYVYIGDI